MDEKPKNAQEKTARQKVEDAVLKSSTGITAAGIVKNTMNIDAVGKIKDGLESAGTHAETHANKVKLEKGGIAIGGAAGVFGMANGVTKALDAYEKQKASPTGEHFQENATQGLAGGLGVAQGGLTAATAIASARMIDNAAVGKVTKTLADAKWANRGMGLGIAAEAAEGLSMHFAAAKYERDGLHETAKVKHEQSLIKGISSFSSAAILYGVPSLAKKVLGFGKSPAALVAGAATIAVSYFVHHKIENLENEATRTKNLEERAKQSGVPLSEMRKQVDAEERKAAEARIAPVARVEISAKTGEQVAASIAEKHRQSQDEHKQTIRMPSAGKP